jgi:ankyrin repeat protein
LLIDKSTELSEAGSLQCSNWWKAYRYKTGAVAPKDMNPLLAAVFFGHEPIVNSFLQDVPRERSLNARKDPAVAYGLQHIVTYEMLDLAIHKGNFAIFKLLFRAASDNEIETNGNWLLLTTQEQKQQNIFQTLVDNPRVKLTDRGYEGKTLLSEIARRGDVESLRSLLALLETAREKEILDLLQQRDFRGRTALSWAAGSGCMEIVSILRTSNRIDMHERDNGGRNAISWAAAGGHHEVVHYLIEASPEHADEEDESGWTPLFWALFRNTPQMVKTLLTSKVVDANRKDEFGRTPLSWASAQKYEESAN